MIENDRNEEIAQFSPDELEGLAIHHVPEPAFGPKGPKLVVTPELDRVHLRAAGLYGESDSFWRELLGNDVCDFWNE